MFLVLLSSCVNKQKDREQAIDPVAVEEAPAMDESYQAALRQNLKDLNSMDSKVDEARESARLYEEQSRSSSDLPSQNNKVIAQSYQFSDVKEAYYLFAERKVFYPDFAFATNSSVGLQSFKNEQGKYGFKIIIDEKVAPIYSVYTKVKDNILDIGFEDRYDFRALMRVTLLSNGKLQMYFPPEKTKTADIFVYAYNQPRETGFSWYEPTLDGLIFHPEAKTGQEAVKKYYTRTLNGSFSEQIYRGEQIIEGKTDKNQH